MAQRFEKLLAERRRQPEYKDMTEVEILHELVEKYNNYKANSAIKRWQLSHEPFH